MKPLFLRCVALFFLLIPIYVCADSKTKETVHGFPYETIEQELERMRNDPKSEYNGIIPWPRKKQIEDFLIAKHQIQLEETKLLVELEKLRLQKEKEKK